MKSIKSIIVIMMAIIAVSISSVAHAADREQLAKELFEAMKMKESLAQVMDIVRQQMSAQAPQMMKQIIGEEKSDMSDEEFEYLTDELMPEYMDKMMGAVFEAIDIDMLIDDIYIPLYVKYFDEENLIVMKEFYESPTGQKMVEVTPQLTGESMQMFMSQSSSVMMDSIKKVQDEMMFELESKFGKD